ncbi:MAG: hypothetical protein ACTSYA_07600 [Candidatus Kariarchaeaceae archaeon]
MIPSLLALWIFPQIPLLGIFMLGVSLFRLNKAFKKLDLPLLVPEVEVNHIIGKIPAKKHKAGEKSKPLLVVVSLDSWNRANLLTPPDRQHHDRLSYLWWLYWTATITYIFARFFGTLTYLFFGESLFSVMNPQSSSFLIIDWSIISAITLVAILILLLSRKATNNAKNSPAAFEKASFIAIIDAFTKLSRKQLDKDVWLMAIGGFSSGDYHLLELVQSYYNLLNDSTILVIEPIWGEPVCWGSTDKLITRETTDYSLRLAVKNGSPDISSGVEVTRTLSSYFQSVGLQSIPIVSKAGSRNEEIGTPKETSELVYDKVISQVSSLIQSLAVSKGIEKIKESKKQKDDLSKTMIGD